jgi:hypothetical protein
MKTTCPARIALPTIEECRQAALALSNEDLKACVIRQCGDITLRCDAETREQCKEQGKAKKETLLAYVDAPYGSTTTSSPVREAHWCEEPASFECILKVVLHELAHTCSWRHGQGGGVPGDVKAIPECECVVRKNGLILCE